MSGLDLQRRLKNAGSTVPVIIITAFDDARSREQAERLGCVAYLRKPCEAETILTLLRGLVHDEPSIHQVPHLARSQEAARPNTR